MSVLSPVPLVLYPRNHHQIQCLEAFTLFSVKVGVSALTFRTWVAFELVFRHVVGKDPTSFFCMYLVFPVLFVNEYYC